MRETRFDSERGPAWIRIRVECFTGVRKKETSRSPTGYEGHFHVECSLESMFDPSRAKRVPRNTQEQAEELLEMFAAEDSGKVCCEGRFLVPQKELPKRGLVNAFLALSASVEDAEMAITGVNFDIRKHPPYQRLRWRLKPEIRGAAELEVQIVTFDDFAATGGSLEKMSEVLWDGARELVIESAPKGGA